LFVNELKSVKISLDQMVDFKKYFVRVCNRTCLVFGPFWHGMDKREQSTVNIQQNVQVSLAKISKNVLYTKNKNLQ